MASISARQEAFHTISLTAQQKATGTPSGMFDASQFKLQVNEDVSVGEIELLQKEFGNNMAGGEWA